jgi:ubiquinone/menaquinone biosynthesis C-methylase UbiE
MNNFQSEYQSNYAGVDELRSNECYLVNYNRDIVEMLSSRSVHNDRVLEFGAGLGTLALIWKNLKKRNQIVLKLIPI